MVDLKTIREGCEQGLSMSPECVKNLSDKIESLCLKVSELEQRLAESETAAWAMRSALECTRELTSDCPCPNCEVGQETSENCLISAALSSTAGRDLLMRLEARSLRRRKARCLNSTN